MAKDLRRYHVPGGRCAIFVITVPIDGDRIRQAAHGTFDEGHEAFSNCREAWLKQLVRWAMGEHMTHPELPQYAGRSYLPRPIDLNQSADEIEKELWAMGADFFVLDNAASWCDEKKSMDQWPKT